MTKGLKVLDDVREQLISITAFVSAKNKELSVMYCFKENDDIKRYVDNVIGLKEIEKELKALEIIKNKPQATLWLFQHCDKKMEYEDMISIFKEDITKEQFELLKEVLL